MKIMAKVKAKEKKKEKEKKSIIKCYAFEANKKGTTWQTVPFFLSKR